MAGVPPSSHVEVVSPGLASSDQYACDVCGSCTAALSHGDLPLFAIANDLAIGCLPPELEAKLTEGEKLLLRFVYRAGSKFVVYHAAGLGRLFSVSLFLTRMSSHHAILSFSLSRLVLYLCVCVSALCVLSLCAFATFPCYSFAMFVGSVFNVHGLFIHSACDLYCAFAFFALQYFPAICLSCLFVCDFLNVALFVCSFCVWWGLHVCVVGL